MIRSGPEGGTLPAALIAFAIDGQEFCLDVKFIMAILNPAEKRTYKINFLDDESRIEYWDGEYLMIDFMPQLKLRKLGPEAGKRLVLVEYKNCKRAFWVDRVLDVIVRNVGNGEVFTFEATEGSPIFSGHVQFDGRSFWLLDPDKMLAIPVEA